ncbi:MAG: peroxiredoxin [Oscillospiraceae bacterium]|nr:peroxiredoxin [Oscillospiraceae bacterium]
MLNTGIQAPEIELPDSHGNTVRLSDFRGKKVILYFYSKDNTAGCTKQAQGYAALYDEFRKKNAVVIGISKDSTASHEKFAAKYDLPFILLSDTERKAIETYDVWKEKKLYGKTSMGVVRTTYLIDENGIITEAHEKVRAADDPSDMLALI